jgi:hypothetical protein
MGTALKDEYFLTLAARRAVRQPLSAVPADLLAGSLASILSSMQKRFYLVLRDLHLYTGLFIGPFVLVFAFSVFVLVHPSGSGPVDSAASPARHIANLDIPANLESLSGRPLVDAARHLLDQAGVHGEIGFVRHSAKQHRLIVPVSVPGRETTFDADLAARTATITQRDTGVWDGLILLHKSPGPHLVAIRMNWLPIRIWRWFADATVYLVLFLSASGIYLWTVLRSERRAGIAMLIAGAISFFGMVYALAG